MINSNSLIAWLCIRPWTRCFYHPPPCSVFFFLSLFVISFQEMKFHLRVNERDEKTLPFITVTAEIDRTWGCQVVTVLQHVMFGRIFFQSSYEGPFFSLSLRYFQMTFFFPVLLLSCFFFLNVCWKVESSLFLFLFPNSRFLVVFSLKFSHFGGRLHIHACMHLCAILLLARTCMPHVHLCALVTWVSFRDIYARVCLCVFYCVHSFHVRMIAVIYMCVRMKWARVTLRALAHVMANNSQPTVCDFFSRGSVSSVALAAAHDATHDAAHPSSFSRLYSIVA